MADAKELIVLGSGGHAKVVIDTLRALGRLPLGIIDPYTPQGETSLFGLTVLGGDDAVFCFSADDVELVNGVGAMPETQLRRILHQRFSDAGYRFATLVHPRAWVSEDVHLDAGVQVMAGAIIQAGSQIGSDCIVNTGASIDHDCKLSPHCHIAPGAVICGNVELGEQVHIGSGATVIQGVKIGSSTIVGAGAIVTRNVAEKMMVYPARPLVTTQKGNLHES